MKITTELFINRAKKIHGNEYEYSQVIYSGMHNKIKIFCNKCKHYFEQKPCKHLLGQGCPYCMGKKQTKEDFIKKAIQIHKNKYNYKESDYKTLTTKICIYCNTCKNYFWQLPNKHLAGQGCPYCTVHVYDTQTFIKKAKLIHKNNYDYVNSIYKNSHTKLQIFCNICQKHFWQSPNSHLSGSGCPHCKFLKLRNGNKPKTTSMEFIKKATLLHKDKYNYDSIIYINRSTPVLIKCNKCNFSFLQTPANHLQGNGCPRCAKKKLSLSTKEFIKKAKKIHRNKYDYAEVTYKSAKEKVEIFCKRCKKYFWQMPYNHLLGKGCPTCNYSKGEEKIKNWLIDHCISFEFQKRFHDCKDKKTLPFDFYIPSLNLCIEFQGSQHYNPDFHIRKIKSQKEGMKKYLIQKKHDEIKKNYCKQKNIKFLEIKYTEKIEEKLKAILL